MMRKTIGPLAVLTVTVLLGAGCGAGGPGGGGKLTGDKIVLAVLNDQSGVYSALSGENSVEAVRMAVEDFKAKYGDDAVTTNIEVVTADHQNKPEIASTKATEMYDRSGADILMDVPTSSAALAVADIAKQKKKLYFNIGAATTDLTGKACNKYTFHYAYDTWMLAHGTGTTATEQGAKAWYIIYPNYAFGQDMNKSFSEAIIAAGGAVVSSEGTPFPNQSGDYSTQLLKAPTLTPTPDTLGVMQAGADLVNVVKQYNEFELRDKGVNLAVGLMFITDIHSLTPDALAGTTFTEAWYWNFDATNRQFADRFFAKTGARPTFAHAANYSAALQYLGGWCKSVSGTAACRASSTVDLG
jgi:branched-chain amino acid transport system substrate-binding protein